MKKSVFIVIEGLEGAGKSTALQTIVDFFQQKHHSVVTTREPGGTPMAEAIRDCVKQDWSDEVVTLETELLLMYAARSQLLENVIKPALANGQIVIGDRHDLSSVAYQGGGRQIPMDMLAQLKHITLKDFKPDLTIYLDIDPQLGLSRAKTRGELDRIELSDIKFFERARLAYQQTINEMQSANPNSAVLIDASQNQYQVGQDILKYLNNWYLSEFA